MSASRFAHDPEKVYPDHAHAPGYEPVVRQVDHDAPQEPIFEGGQIRRFLYAIALVFGGLTLLAAIF